MLGWQDGTFGNIPPSSPFLLLLLLLLDLLTAELFSASASFTTLTDVFDFSLFLSPSFKNKKTKKSVAALCGCICYFSFFFS